MIGARRACAVVALAAAAGLVACHARPRTGAAPAGLPRGEHEAPAAAHAGVVAELDLSHGAPELGATGLLSSSGRQSYFHLVERVLALATDDDVSAVFVRFGATRLGWARAQELGTLLDAVRRAGKPVVCHAEELGNATYWTAARGCDRVWLSPAGQVDTVGIAAQVVYANRLLTKKLGIDVDFLQIGKFKGAEEPLTRDGPSEEARASLESTLAAVRAAWVQGLVEARGEKLREAIEDGPFAPDAALARGLVDQVGYLDGARDDAHARGHTDESEVRFGGARAGGSAAPFAEVVRALASGRAGGARGPHVALVRAVGAISMESAGGPLGGRGGISEHALGRLVRRLADDEAVRAVVLRIDSPGGSALASDLLWHELMKLRADKPLVVSIGDMAASGGYYLASTAHRIVAEPTSIVGSIGVVGGKLGFGGALEAYGVHAETFAAAGTPGAATRAGYESPLVAWDDATRERVRASMTAVYDLFLRRVAEGRGQPVERIAASAEGRIFAGQVALDRGLVDEWGGLVRAIAVARDLAHGGADLPVRVAAEPSGLLEWLDASDDGDDEEAGALGRALGAGASATLGQVAPSLATCAASLLPLAHGEHAVAALPFTLDAR